MSSHPSPATPPIIDTTDLRRTFTGRGAPVEAVRGVNLRVAEGEIFGFLGPNGAGKTTTLRMLTTLLPPTSGTATVAGFDLLNDAKKVREAIGYVAQGGSTDPAATGREELILQARLYGLDLRTAKARAAELLEVLELEAAADRATATWSGGMKRRLDLGLGLVHRPKLLFLDEPTTGLDPQARAHLWGEIRRFREAGTTVFLTTHYLDEADALVDRLAIIDHGLIVAEGSPDALKREVGGDVVTLGVDGSADLVRQLVETQPYVRESTVHEGAVRLFVDRRETALPALLRVLGDAGVAPDTVGVAGPSLDDVFLRHTGRSLRDEAA